MRPFLFYLLSSTALLLLDRTICYRGAGVVSVVQQWMSSVLNTALGMRCSVSICRVSITWALYFDSLEQAEN